MKYLIVNADDFGMSRGTNEGIVKAMRDGIATGVSILAAGGAFDDAVGLARANGIHGVGAHLSFTEIPNLILKDRVNSLESFVAGSLFGTIRQEDVRREFRSQLDRIRAAGLEITHLDTHEHLHLLPKVRRILIDLALEYKIPAIRPYRVERIAGRPTAGRIYRSLVNRYFANKDKVDGISCADHLIGFLDSGKLSEGLLVEMLGSLDEGVTELVAHPGFLDPDILDRFRWHKNCEYELYALTSRKVKRVIEEKGIKLITHQEALREGPGDA